MGARTHVDARHNQQPRDFLAYQGRYKEVEVMYERVLEDHEKALGEDAIVIYVFFLNTVTNLGIINADIRQVARVEDLYKVALIDFFERSSATAATGKTA